MCPSPGLRRRAAPLAAAAVCAGWLLAARPGAGLPPAVPASPATPAPPASELAGAPLDDLLQRRDTAAVEELERRFATLTDKLQKQRIAVVLVSHRAADEPYFDYLADFARRAVASQVPFPWRVDSAAKVVVQQYSAAFQSWAASQHADADVAAAKAVQENPTDVYLLALADDARSVPILLDGVEAANYLVAYRAAFGLARLHYNAAVPRIIAAADRAPGEAADLIARTLVLFDDRAAQAAADRLIVNKELLAALRADAPRELALNIGDS
jgi:hypothetical protein